jgi:hypothetical protein
MAEEPATPPAPPEPAPPPAPAPAPTPPTPPAPAAEVTPDWPEDWRDRFVAKAKVEEREKLSKRLARFASPDNVLSSYLDLDRRVSQGNLKPVLDPSASEEEVAAFRKQWGVPDKIEDYGIAFPDTLEVGESEQAELNEFLTAAQKINAPPEIVKGITGWYFEQREKQEQAAYDQAVETTVNYRAQIKAEYGRDFDRNVRLAKAELNASLGSPERVEGLIGLTLNDGTKLGDHPDFIRYVVQHALSSADERDLVQSELSGSGMSLDQTYQQALDLKFTDPKQYHSEAHQKRLQQLASAKASAKNRAA